MALLLFPEGYASAQNLRLNVDDDFPGAEIRDEIPVIIGKTLSFLDRQSSTLTGLPESFRGSSLYYYDSGHEQFYLDKEPYLGKQSFTYDLALGVIAYAACGRPQPAVKLLEKLKKEFYREKNGGYGLYNSYRCDKLTPEGDLWMGIDGDRIHAGPNAWAAVACLHYANFYDDPAFIPLAVDICRWLSGLAHYKFSDGTRGAVSMGFGWGPDWSRTYSTENCLVYYGVLRMLRQIYERSGPDIRAVFEKRNFTDIEINDELDALAKWFVMIVYNPDSGGFYCGVSEEGIDPVKAVDTVSHAIMGIGADTLEKWGIEARRLLDFAQKHLLVRDEVRGRSTLGFDFTVPEEIGNPRRRLIWVEGTAQMITAYKLAGAYYARKGDMDSSLNCRLTARKLTAELNEISRLLSPEELLLPYSSAVPKDKELMLTYKSEWEIPRGENGKPVFSAASTLWRLFAVLEFNPLELAPRGKTRER